MYLTVGQLKKDIKDLPDDTKVYYQHIDDSYIWRGGWKPIKILDKENSLENFKVYDYHHRAFCAYKQTHNGEDILILTAHY